MEREGSYGRRSEDSGPRGGGRGRERRMQRRKVCRFCEGKMNVDIRDTILLRGFLSERGRIVSRRVSGNCARHQRQVTRGIRRGRHAALLPYTAV